MATLAVVEGWRGPRRRDEEIITPPLSENAIHSPGGKRWFEHWYFDARLDSGHVVVVMLQARELIHRAPGIEIHVYEPDGTRHEISRRYPEPAVWASSERCDIRIATTTPGSRRATRSCIAARSTRARSPPTCAS